MPNDVVAAPPKNLIAVPPGLLDRIRPEWQSKDLIARVRRLLPVDPSSACQRIFNAALHDLRQKIVIAGLDIAREAAKHHGLPRIESEDEAEEYPASKLIDLAYRMGVLTRPDWRRLHRVYEIRRDLEHEDDEYEADEADCVSVFSTCINVVLAKDPIQVLRVGDVKDVIQQDHPVTANESLLEDVRHLPAPRQEEIAKFLIGIALDRKQPDIVRQNAMAVLRSVGTLLRSGVKVALGTFYQDRIGRNPLDVTYARVLHAAGVLVYLRDSQRRDFFAGRLAGLEKIGVGWRQWGKHGDALRELREVGGLRHCPPPVRAELVEWMVLTYMGEPGGYGTWGQNRPVFYSNSAEPLIEDMIRDAAATVRDDLRACETKPAVQAAARNQHVARRFQNLLDLVDDRESPEEE